MNYQPKTREEIEYLKKNWEFDPCWDIETTEGFQEHYQELLDFRNLKEKEWSEKFDKTITQFSTNKGLLSNRELAEYLYQLQQEIDSLKQELFYLKSGV